MSLWIAACGGGIASTTPTPPANGVTSVTVTPNPETAIIGTQVQFTATVAGTGSFSTAATWSVATSDGSGNDPGDIGTTGLYTTPYPAPATVTVTATSTENTNVSGNATITLNPPAALTNTNALTVNVSSPGNPISPLIYGMAAWVLDPINSNPTIADAFLPANISIMRWGGDSTERYNYQLDVTSQASANYFKNLAGTGGDDWTPVSGVSAFDEMVTYNAANGIETVGTVPVQGWVAKDSTSCSFPTSTYPNQTEVSGTCGNGIEPNGASEGSGPTCTSSAGCDITGNDPTLASISAPPPTPADPIGPSWTGDWVTYLVNKFGPGISGNSVAIYQLDNEPKGWVGFDRDVHPNPFTYDELTNGGIGTALAIKTADPTVLVSGPVQDYWQSYFYSGADIADGATAGPCDQFWSNPLDREAHGGVALIPYYLEQFAAAETTYGKRLLDYVDLHTYFAAEYPASSGTSVDLNYDANEDASNTAAQAARLNSTRVFWDPTYTDSSNRYPQPNYFTDPNYTTSCTLPQQAPEVIPMMRNWVAADYPGTKLAISEYNWGALDQVNGALAEADILGIFGREGLDWASFWPSNNPYKQIPLMQAFAIYRNYDGNKSMFGDTVLPATTVNQGNLSIYAALRSSDGAVTIVVINKTYGSLTDTLTLAGLSPKITTAQAYQYSNANLNTIIAQPAVTVTPGGAASSISYTFPAQSITLFVIPQT